MQHAAAVKNPDYSKLMTVPKVFPDCELGHFSHHVVTVQPHEFLVRHDRWAIDFKSARIARGVVVSMWSLELDQLRNMYHSLRDTPGGSGVAGGIFDAIAHRVLSSKDRPKNIPMVTSKDVPPTFSSINSAM